MRLQPGVVPGDWASAVRDEAGRRGLALAVDARAAPELEDVFVALLEQQQERSP